MLDELIALAAALMDKAEGVGVAISTDLLIESKLDLSLAAAASIASLLATSRLVCASHSRCGDATELLDSRLSTGERGSEAKIGTGDWTAGRGENLSRIPLQANAAALPAPGVSTVRELGRRSFSRDEAPGDLLGRRVLLIVRLFGLGDLDCLMLGTGDANEGSLAA